MSDSYHIIAIFYSFYCGDSLQPSEGSRYLFHLQYCSIIRVMLVLAAETNLCAATIRPLQNNYRNTVFMCTSNSLLGLITVHSFYCKSTGMLETKTVHKVPWKIVDHLKLMSSLIIPSGLCVPASLHPGSPCKTLGKQGNGCIHHLFLMSLTKVLPGAPHW